MTTKGVLERNGYPQVNMSDINNGTSISNTVEHVSAQQLPQEQEGASLRISNPSPESSHEETTLKLKLKSMSQTGFEQALSKLVNPDGGLLSTSHVEPLLSIMRHKLNFLQQCLILNLLGCTADNRLILKK
jgi:hypothetical protein